MKIFLTVLQVAMSFKYLKNTATASKMKYCTLFELRFLIQLYKQIGCPNIQGEMMRSQLVLKNITVYSNS